MYSMTNTDITYNRKLSIVLISIFGYDFGIRYISAFLKAKGYQTHIIQFNQLRYVKEFLDNDYFTGSLLNHKVCFQDDLCLLIDVLKKLKPNVIGISLTSVGMRTARIITAEIKKHLESTVVWGGIHAIVSPEECIQHADIVCTGEGEIPMWELVEKMASNQPLTGIRNLWINKKGEIERNELRPLLDNLDDLPFPDFIDRENKLVIDNGRIGSPPFIVSGYESYSYPIVSSRGCMFSCSFCSNSIIKEKYQSKGSYLRRRSVDNVIEELKYAIDSTPIGLVRFWDDVFTYDKDWISEFCRRYSEEIGKPFACYAHPKYTDRDILAQLAKVGLISIIVGLQSGSEDLNRKIFKRSQSNHDILEFSNFILRTRINPRYDLISDNPYETEDMEEATLELLLKLPRPFIVQMYSLCYFPKTPLTIKALKEGVISEQDLEQNTSKALNNFFLFPQLSRSRQKFFWNCLKAMAVNHHFPKVFVRFCKHFIFFRWYPQLLFHLCKYYLQLFKPLGKKQMRIWITPAFMERIFIEDYLMFGNVESLFRDIATSYRFHKVNSEAGTNQFVLHIKNKSKTSQLRRFLIELIPLKETNLLNKTIWLFEYRENGDFQSQLPFDFTYPKLFLLENGRKTEVRMLQRGNFKAGQKEELFVFKISYQYTKITLGISNSKCQLIGYSLCTL